MEDVLVGVEAYYQGSLGAELAAIGTERGASVPAWKLMDTAVIKDKQYPMIEVLPSTIEYDNEVPANPRLPPLENHFVTVRVKQAGSEQKNVQNDLLRYQEGIRRVTAKDFTYGGRFKLVRLEGASFGDLLEAQQGGDLQQELLIDLWVQVARWGV